MCSYNDEQKWLSSFALFGCCCCACYDRRQIGMLRAIVNFYNLSQRAIADSPSDHKITWAYIKTTMHPVVQKIINSKYLDPKTPDAEIKEYYKHLTLEIADALDRISTRLNSSH